MWERVKVKTRPTQRPITLADLKKRIRVDFDDDDSLIAQYLDGAIARIDGPAGIGYAMMEQTWTLSLDVFPNVIYLPGAPVTDVVSIKYYDGDDVEQTLDSANYRVDYAGDEVRIEPVDSWPGIGTRMAAVSIDYTVGAADASDVPADLVDAVCLLVAHRYEMRQPVITGTIVAEVPMGFDSIVAQYHRLAFA